MYTRYAPTPMFGYREKPGGLYVAARAISQAIFGIGAHYDGYLPSYRARADRLIRIRKSQWS